MVACCAVIESVQNHAESLVERQAVGVVENTVMISFDLHIRVELQGGLASYVRLRFSDVLFVEQELAIQVADVDCVEIDLKRETNNEENWKVEAVSLTISMSLKPHITRFLRTSQPIPPAPTTSSFDPRMRSFKSLRNTPAISEAILTRDFRGFYGKSLLANCCKVMSYNLSQVLQLIDGSLRSFCR